MTSQETIIRIRVYPDPRRRAQMRLLRMALNFALVLGPALIFGLSAILASA